MSAAQKFFAPLMIGLLWVVPSVAGPIEESPRRGGTLIHVTGASPANLTCGFEKSAHTNVVTEMLY
ncbi:MAG: hypothetical protein HYY45_22095, partial [Deltaproteobacteria bacterium]|nr:hypothetical protein [Deltaproteobacteria bacterium]